MSGTVIQFLGAMTGGGLLGGWTIDGDEVAERDLIVNHVEGGQFPRITVRRCSGAYVTLTTQTEPDPVGGCRNNHFGILATDTLPRGATGLLLDGITSIKGNILQNNFDIVDIPLTGDGAIGIDLGYCDFNRFGIVDLSLQSDHISSVGIRFRGRNKLFPSMNHFGLVAAECGVLSETTNGTPFGNRVDLYDLPDSQHTVPAAVGLYGWAAGYNGVTRLGNLGFGFINPGWDTKTPAVPGGIGREYSATNPNPFPVTIYQATTTGYPIGQHIVDQHGTDNVIAASLPSFTLYQGEKVYYTARLNSWIWYGVAT